MRRFTISFVIGAFVLLLVVLYTYSGIVQKPNSVQPHVVHDLPRIALQPLFFERDNFERAIVTAETVDQRDDIRAIVVPQHLLASELIAEQIKRASGNDVTQVVIIGPNHFNSGVGTIATANAVWQTPFGDVRSDADLVNRFMADFDLPDQPDIFLNEHAVGAVVPFVAHYLPDARILPVVFNSYATERDAQRVSAWLAGHLSYHSLVIYSIDFSHYLTRERADMNDRETRAFIEQNDLARIMTLGNDHLDSPASLVSALTYAERMELKTNILSVTNSDDYSIERTPETTSYFSIMFTH